jgi:hypothetical protein
MLGLSFSIPTQRAATKFSRGGASLVQQDYADRVIADGGIVEAAACFTKAVFYLGVRNTYNYTELIFDRWLADGATVEAEACFNKSFFSINVS